MTLTGISVKIDLESLLVILSIKYFKSTKHTRSRCLRILLFTKLSVSLNSLSLSTGVVIGIIRLWPSWNIVLGWGKQCFLMVPKPWSNIDARKWVFPRSWHHKIWLLCKYFSLQSWKIVLWTWQISNPS